MVRPRVEWLPPGGKRSKLGDQAVELAFDAGLELDDWQAHVVRQAFRKRGGKWAAFEVGVNVARQNGKGSILEAVMLASIYLCGDSYVTYSAHLYDTSMEHFRRVRFLIEETPKLSGELLMNKRGGVSIKHGHGEEGIEFKGNRRMRFRTRSRGSGRGLSGDRVILDEAMFLPEFTHSAMMPMVSAMPDSQVWYAGSAVDQQVHEHGVVFSRLRDRALRQDDPMLAYFEWSVEGDNPEEVDPGVLEDQAAWGQANPALGVRIRPAVVGAELRSMGPRGFAVERLGVGDWPRPDFRPQQIITPEQWMELEDVGSVLQDPVFLSFDVSPERRSSIAAAGASSRGGFHVEIVADADRTGWVVKRLVELVQAHRPVAVVCDDYGPAASLIPAFRDVGVDVTTYTASDYSRACGRFVDVIQEKNLRHLGSGELVSAVSASRTRPLGDSWAWSRKNSEGTISPLVAATLAVDAAVVGVGSSVYDSREMITL